jgi:hypothetical protein
MENMSGGNIVRSSNTKRFATLGDPERWGSSGKVRFIVQNPGGLLIAESVQVVRAQSADLAALNWTLALQWQIKGPWVDATDALYIGASLVVGLGSTSFPLSFYAWVAGIRSVNNGWAGAASPSDQSNNAAVASVPFPATSVAGRVIVGGTTTRIARELNTLEFNLVIAPLVFTP